MKLKQLTLQGYKSFAAKTEFKFCGGITAVVGPNGSGKSNVADAILWALGEQSMRALRGRSTGDMIFAGGRRRARAGMAEASLTLDNSDRWLPIDYGEVTISRRAYRSGENEYLVNGARVRLRDIGELLADSGLSRRAYAVIGQGLVDAALSLRPQERRTLFEEAAGIAFYRTRREEAVDRLGETERNLERVRDILTEITPRLEMLKREAARVEERRRLSAHLKRLQRTWYGYRWGQQQNALGRALELAGALADGAEACQEEMVQLGKDAGHLRQLESELRAKLKDWRSRGSDLQTRVSDLERQLAVAEERARLLQARHDELLSELERLKAQRQAQAEGVAQSRSAVERSQAQLQRSKAHLTELERKQPAQREARLDAPSLQEHGDGPQRAGGVGETAAESLEFQSLQLERELAASRAQAEELSSALIAARAEGARLRGRLEATSAAASEAGADSLALNALRAAKLPGILGPLESLVELPTEWQPALRAALGRDLRVVVVDRLSVVGDARSALLATGERLTLLPLDFLRKPPPLPASAVSAASVVSCLPTIRPAVEAILGSVALCDNIADALALLPAMPAGSRCVTAAGDVLWAVGALSVGQVDVDGGEAQRRDLRTSLEETERHSRDIEDRRRKEAVRTMALETQLSTLTARVIEDREDAAWKEREAVAQARTEVAVADQALLSACAVSEREGALLARIGAQIAARHERTEELTEEHASLVGRIEHLRSQTAVIRERLRGMQAQIHPAQEKTDRLSDELAAIAQQERRVRMRLRDAEARRGQAELEVERCRDRLRLLAQRAEEDLGLVELELAEDVTAQTPLPLRPLVTDLPVVEELPEGLEDEVQRLKARLHRLRGVNPNAPAEYGKTKDRHHFLTDQSNDLQAAVSQLRQVVAELDELMEAAFRATFEAVAAEFSDVFTGLFGGGRARLELTDPTDLMSTGVDIVAQPPGKRAQRLALLSGGERALTATALLFSLLRVSPTPFCVLDEVDAMLDEANVERFRGLLEEMAADTQFIVITHNRVTVEAADALYGVSMGADSVSKVVSLRMD